MKIAFFDAKPYDIKSFDEINKQYKFEIKYFKFHLNEESVEITKGYDAVCTFVNDDISKNVIDKLYANGIRLIALRCAGYNNVEFKEAFNKIHIVRVPAYSPYAVAEHALALIMSLNRKTHKAYNRTRESNFNINGLLGFDLYQKTAGVIGTGKIGKVFIDILLGLGMKVLAYDPFPDKEFAKNKQIEYVALPQLYKNSDIISLHCPLSKETHHIIDQASIGQMKEGVMIINTSRGGLIDTKALITGLKTRKIGSAGLDVYEEESEYFFEDFSSDIMEDDKLARLLSFNNVVVTSHQAFFTKEALANIATTTLENIREFKDGENLKHEICYLCGENPKDCRKLKSGECFK